VRDGTSIPIAVFRVTVEFRRANIMRKLGANNTADLARMLQCMSPLLAQSGHIEASSRCPLLGVKRTSRKSAFDPKADK
jgi:hypothetical protein